MNIYFDKTRIDFPNPVPVAIDFGEREDGSFDIRGGFVDFESFVSMRKRKLIKELSECQ
jgi:hypothetical protein